MAKYIIALFIVLGFNVSALYAQQIDSTRLEKSQRRVEKVQKKVDRTQHRIDKKQKKLDRREARLNKKERKADKESRKLDRQERKREIIQSDSTRTTTFFRPDFILPKTSARAV